MGLKWGKSWPPRWWPWGAKNLGGFGKNKNILDADKWEWSRDDRWKGASGLDDEELGWNRGTKTGNLWGNQRRILGPKWAYQTLGSVLLLLFVLGLFQLEAPWAVNLQEQLYQAATQNLDYQPVRQAMVRLGMWTDSTAAVPVIAVGGPDSMSGRAGLKVTVPAQGVITQLYGWQKVQGKDQFFPGVMIATAKGAPVVSPVEGRVTAVRDDTVLGKVVGITWKDGRVCLFGRLEEVTVKRGQEITSGEVIGRVGAAGQGSDAFLYWELRQGEQTVDPLNWQGKAGKFDAGSPSAGSASPRQ